jgi:GntR family transcriptional repressor for pyruvate dehydrogenase complex
MKSSNPDMKSPRPPSVAEQVRVWIRQRGLAPGDRLPTHGELCSQLGIGPRRLREGLSVLEHQGVLETRNKAGTLVRRPPVEALTEPIGWCLDAESYVMEDLVRARAHLESGAAAEAATRRTPRDLLEILDALEQLERCTSARQDDRRQEEALHLAILQATHNAVLATFGQLIRLQIGRVAGRPSRQRREAYTNEHRAIYEAIERRDATAARELMFAHIARQLPAVHDVTVPTPSRRKKP